MRILCLLVVVAGSRLLWADDISFRHSVLPILSKSGCNAGACHANLNGKGGLKLSLRGEDAQGDYDALTRGMLARRVEPLAPAKSLLLLKATGQVPHEGGVRFGANSFEAKQIEAWIAAGALLDSAEGPKPVELKLSLADGIAVDPVDRIRLTATAKFSDGTTSDVTALSCFDFSAVGIAKLGEPGEIVRERTGEVVVAVRYQHLQKPLRIAFLPNRPAVDLSKRPAKNRIDELVLADLQKLRIEPSAPCDDATFLRRAYLDVCGILPSASEARKFLDDPDSTKHDRLIDALLNRREYADHWASKWADLLRVEEKTLDRKGAMVFHRWIRDRIAGDTPLTEFARELLGARGSTYANPPANFYRAIREPYQRAESVAQVFLGLRIGCAKCHNHPFDAWTQDDYHRFAGLFARIDYRVLENKRLDNLDQHEFVGEQIVMAKRFGELSHPRGGDARPKLLGSDRAFDKSTDRLAVLADWVAAPENPYFARTQANRIWANAMGRGLVDPVDDFKATNPPSNPELLSHLATLFAEGGYRTKPLLRAILTSNTYRASSLPNTSNSGEDRHFARAIVRPIAAEALMDATAKSLDANAKWPGYPLGTRAGELAATPRTGSYEASSKTLRFLKVFGKPERLLTCECERSDDPGMFQAFQMLTGEALDGMLKRKDNRLGKLLASDIDDRARLEELYLATLSRRPSAAEELALLKSLSSAESPRAGWEDIAWSLLNSKEFLLRR